MKPRWLGLIAAFILVLFVLGCRTESPTATHTTTPLHRSIPTIQSVTSTDQSFPSLGTRTAVPSQLQTALAKTPTATPVTTPFVPATAQSQNGTSLKLLIYAVGDPSDGNPTYKLGLLRGKSLFWLRSSNTPNKFGCERDSPDYYTYGCYGGSANFSDLDGDGEPEIISQWIHDGSCSTNSVHVHGWNGTRYELLLDLMGCQLSIEQMDLDNDAKPELVVRYDVGYHSLPTAWLDVWSFDSGKSSLVNEKYPRLYQELLQKYAVLKPEYERAASKGWQEEYEILLEHIRMAEKIILGK